MENENSEDKYPTIVLFSEQEYKALIRMQKQTGLSYDKIIKLALSMFEESLYPEKTR